MTIPTAFSGFIRFGLYSIVDRCMESTAKIIVPPEEAGKRLDLFLAAHLASLTRSRIQGLIDENMVSVNGRPVKASHKVREREEITVTLPEPATMEAIPEEILLNVLYEDRDVIVVNKPAGMVVHPAAGNYTGTLVNALLHHCKDLSGIGGVVRPGIVHRLDKDTTGVMVAAKNDKAHSSLSEQFKKHTIKRRYVALVHGIMKEDKGKIEAEIGRHESDRKKMSVRTKRGKKAVTRYKVISSFDRFSLLELSLETGRTHQIRVHLSSINHPVAGDPVYGGTARLNDVKEAKVKKAIKKLGRQALHAAVLGFIHPGTEKYMEFRVPLPADFQEIIDLLGK